MLNIKKVKRILKVNYMQLQSLIEKTNEQYIQQMYHYVLQTIHMRDQDLSSDLSSFNVNWKLASARHHTWNQEDLESKQILSKSWNMFKNSAIHDNHDN